jgi:hypothetical protein
MSTDLATPDDAKPLASEPHRGESLLATAGKAVVFSVVGFATYRLLGHFFRPPVQPIVLMLESGEGGEE